MTELAVKSGFVPDNRTLAWVALVFNGFAFLTINYWVYTARWTFLARNSDTYFERPTISRAISDPYIGEPFAFWITLSGISLVIGVFALVAIYWRLLTAAPNPGFHIRAVIWLILPGLLALQVSSGVGMYWLSVYRFPDANAAHMVGSYTFFLSQAAVVIMFTLFNFILLRDPQILARLESQGELARKWVRVRFVFGLFCMGYVFIYFALFTAKETAAFGDNDTLYLAYVSAEPTLITAFLVLLALAHVDLFARRQV